MTNIAEKLTDSQFITGEGRTSTCWSVPPYWTSWQGNILTEATPVTPSPYRDIGTEEKVQGRTQIINVFLKTPPPPSPSLPPPSFLTPPWMSLEMTVESVAILLKLTKPNYPSAPFNSTREFSKIPWRMPTGRSSFPVETLAQEDPGAEWQNSCRKFAEIFCLFSD